MLKAAKFLAVMVAIGQWTAIASAQPCTLTKLHLEPKTANEWSRYHAPMGAHEFVVVNTNNKPWRPTFPDGFAVLSNTTGKPVCQDDDVIVDEAYVDQSGMFLLIIGSNGAMTTIGVTDIRECKKVFSAEMYTAGVVVPAGQALIVLPGCECVSPNRCNCEPGAVFSFGEKCLPKKDAGRSESLTKATVGVGFATGVGVSMPWTSNATLLTK